MHFTENLFKRLGLDCHRCSYPLRPNPDYDRGLRNMLFGNTNAFIELAARMQTSMAKNPSRIWILEDLYACNYIFIPLPASETEDLLLCGPFSFERMTVGHVRELWAKLKADKSIESFVKQYYANLPVLADQEGTEKYLACLGEALYGESFDGVWNLHDVDFLARKLPGEEDPNELSNEMIQALQTRYVSNGQQDQPPMSILKKLEERYEGEEKMMECIASGDTAGAMKCLDVVHQVPVQQRLPDRLRDEKNYLIILNTLCRKGAQAAQVHPIYLDQISGHYAQEIEALTSVRAVSALTRDMLRRYCELTNQYAARGYSPLIQQVIHYISIDIAGDLSLKRLAELANVNASYLSARFKKEVHQTLTEFVTNRRLDFAAYLLTTHTESTVQEIAEQCGIGDLTYFTKIFRQRKGITPGQYRRRKGVLPPPAAREEPSAASGNR